MKSAPHVTYLPSSRRWRLLEPYVVFDGAYVIMIPAPFHFDLASVPRWLWTRLAPFELGIVPALVHDFIYRRRGRLGNNIAPHRTYTRLEADVLFLALMKAAGVAPVRRRLAYAAVRVFGWRSWRRPRR